MQSQPTFVQQSVDRRDAQVMRRPAGMRMKPRVAPVGMHSNIDTQPIRREPGTRVKPQAVFVRKQGNMTSSRGVQSMGRIPYKRAREPEPMRRAVRMRARNPDAFVPTTGRPQRRMTFNADNQRMDRVVGTGIKPQTEYVQNKGV